MPDLSFAAIGVKAKLITWHGQHQQIAIVQKINENE